MLNITNISKRNKKIKIVSKYSNAKGKKYAGKKMNDGRKMKRILQVT
jgi:hypothetical protein